MGSSCHSRGNYDLARLLSAYAEQEPVIRLVGALCRNRCAEGPVVVVNGEAMCNPEPMVIKARIAGALAERA